MQIILCPGVHPANLTTQFVQALDWTPAPQIFPAPQQPAYSGGHILAFLLQQFGTPQTCDPLLLIGFSAGVVGAITAAHGWQNLGGQIRALIAIDGWGVPLFGTFPIHRLSHDAFTHWSSAIVGSGQASFYAEPDVAHLDLWQSPQQAQGWAQGWAQPLHTQHTQQPHAQHTHTTAAQFLRQLLQQYSGLSSTD